MLLSDVTFSFSGLALFSAAVVISYEIGCAIGRLIVDALK